MAHVFVWKRYLKNHTIESDLMQYLRYLLGAVHNLKMNEYLIRLLIFRRVVKRIVRSFSMPLLNLSL